MSTTTPESKNPSPGESTATAIGDTAKDAANRAASYAAEAGQEAAQHYLAEPAADLFTLVKEYAREKPDVAAFWCFGLGILVGWKLKP